MPSDEPYLFLDPDNPEDIKLLHASVRDDAELDTAIEKAQWEVIEAFSQRDMQALAVWEPFFKFENGADPTQKIRVRLIGYDEDDPEASDEGLKEALKRTIADIVSWGLRSYSNVQNVSSIRQGQRSITYSGMVPSWNKFPSGWDYRLKNYDARIKQYGI